MRAGFAVATTVAYRDAGGCCGGKCLCMHKEGGKGNCKRCIQKEEGEMHAGDALEVAAPAPTEGGVQEQLQKIHA